MDPVLTSVTLAGFRSFAGTRIALANPTYLVGKNGSGKSNFCDALAFLADAVGVNLQYALTQRGGLRQLLYRADESPDGLAPCLAMRVEFGPIPDQDIGSAVYAFAVEPAPETASRYRVLREYVRVMASDEPFVLNRWYDPSKRKERVRDSHLNIFALFDDDVAAKVRWSSDGLLMPTWGMAAPFSRLVDVIKGIRIYHPEPGAVAQSTPNDAEAVPEHSPLHAGQPMDRCFLECRIMPAKRPTGIRSPRGGPVRRSIRPHG